ncbi:hypothetical protein FACS1894211_14460 [Clostridia bacterium]|nr:hypothetical protein FACS1894211_14460 [Clostridia bacterium]
MKINSNFLNLKDDYLFATVADRVAKYKRENPDRDVIRLGIGDVTLPLPPVVVKAMANAAKEMGEGATFRGYGDYGGYPFLQEAIAGYYKEKGVALDKSEVFVGDGAKSDLGNILDIFDTDNTVLVPDPVYPVYVDTNVMAGRKVLFTGGNADNQFLPLPDEKIQADIIYICSPNNPTGAVYDRAGLKKWVEYARAAGAVILFDAAYEAFIQDKSLPTSIYEIEGARDCCIEFCSLSKTAGFTGTRCGYTVIPHTLKCGGYAFRHGRVNVRTLARRDMYTHTRTAEQQRALKFALGDIRARPQAYAVIHIVVVGYIAPNLDVRYRLAPLF